MKLRFLKREEIYVSEYRNMDQSNIAAFIDNYYNRLRLHSSLGYKPRSPVPYGAVSSELTAQHTRSL